MGLRQREGRDGARGAAGEVLLLLLRGAEELERLGDADRLVRGEERTEVPVAAPDHLHHLAVLGDREAEAPVLLRHLHPEGPEPAQPLDHVVGILAGRVDGDRVDVLAQEALHIPVELGELGPFGRRREGVDEIERQLAEEELAQEGSPFPLFLASLLGDLARLLFGGHPDFGGAHANPPGFISIGVDTPQHNYARSSPMSNRAVEGRSRADRALARHRAAKLHSGSSPKWARVIRSFRYSSVPRSSTMSPPVS